MNDVISLDEDDYKGLLVLGDVFFNEKDMEAFFDLVKNDLRHYIVLANLEGSINFLSNYKSKKSVHLKLPIFEKSEIPKNLFFSLVNNHVTDFGIKNFYKNLEHIGHRALVSSHKRPVRLLMRRKFIFFADKKEQCILHGTNFLSFSRNNIEKLSNELQDSIVIVHGGIENRVHPTLYQRHLARLIIDKGAETVIFHHSHVIGFNEVWKKKLIHYGLGNAYFSNLLNLHSLDQCTSEGVLISNSTKILKFNKLIFEKNIDIGKNNFVFSKSDRDYLNFYKQKYKIDASFRPRQLSTNDLIINFQYFTWSLIANFLVRYNLSQKIKPVLKKFLKDKNKI